MARSECRPGVNTHLQMTPGVCSTHQTQQGKGKNNKVLAVPANENGTRITPEAICSHVVSTYSIHHKVVSVTQTE